jgi:hypothetical protein
MNIRTSPSTARISAVVGAFVWSVLLFIRTSPSYETELIVKILLLGVLVIVPLGLALAAKPDGTGQHFLVYRLAIIAQPIGAVAVILSFFIQQGIAAALLASLWLVVTALVALFGLWRLLFGGQVSAHELCLGAGLIYLPVGGVSLLFARFGAHPLGFGDTIVLLTAVHFHFAGFAAPLIAGLAGRALNPGSAARPVFRLAAVGVIAGRRSWRSGSSSRRPSLSSARW